MSGGAAAHVLMEVDMGVRGMSRAASLQFRAGDGLGQCMEGCSNCRKPLITCVGKSGEIKTELSVMGHTVSSPRQKLSDPMAGPLLRIDGREQSCLANTSKACNQQ